MVSAAPATVVLKEIKTAAPVEIIKQIHEVNDDGSYTFGFEATDGSYRAENRDANGHVTGRYGYIDANGQLQEFGKPKLSFVLFEFDQT